jgi:hypothetical protein
MTAALTVLLAFISCLVLFDVAALAGGADSREGLGDDRRR